MFKIFELTLIIVYSVGIVRAAVLSSQSVTPTTITTPKAAHQQHQRKISLNETPLYQYSSKQDPETAEFLRNVEEKFFTSSSNSNKSSTRSLQKRDTNYQDQCENPDQEYLEDLLSEYQIHYRKFEETVLKSKLDPSQDQALTSMYTNQEGSDAETDNKEFNSRFIDQTQCNPDDRNMTNLNQQSK